VSVPVSPARGATPSLSLSYNSGSGNGIFGLGWDLALGSIKRETSKGLPRYYDAIESDIFLFSEAEDLVPELSIDRNGAAASYASLKAAGLDAFGDALVNLENLFPFTSSIDGQTSSSSVPYNLLGIGQTLYFCVPPNAQLLGWSTTLAGILHLIPQIAADIKPLGCGAGLTMGGDQIGAAAGIVAQVAPIMAASYTHSAAQAAKMASYIRREQEWVFQANLVIREIVQLDKQAVSAQIKLQIAENELADHLSAGVFGTF